MDFDQFKQRQAQVWGLGDYSVLSRVLEPAAQALCGRVRRVGRPGGARRGRRGRELRARLRARGSQRRGHRHLPGPGRARAGPRRGGGLRHRVAGGRRGGPSLRGRPLRLRRVGVRHDDRPAAGGGRPELFRVVRPGNTVGITAWTPAASPSRCSRSEGATPRFPPVSHQRRVGPEDTVRERFEGLAGTLEIERRTLDWEAPSPDDFVASLEATRRRRWPPRPRCRRTRSRPCTPTTWPWSAGAGGDGAVSIGAEYLLAVARKRG